MRPRGRATPTVSQVTPPGRGAVATIRLRGPVALLESAGFRAASGRSLGEHDVDRIVYGRWGEDPSEDVVVCRTGADETEIHCHGGDVAVRCITEDLSRCGVAIVPWNANVWLPRLDRELLETVARAPTLRTATIALEQSNGLLRAAFERLVGHGESGAVDRACNAIERLSRWRGFGEHLVRPWRVVLTGRPNVGKSSLVNALLGYTRLVVFDEPGTTRDVVTSLTALDGWPVELVDTAGLRDGAQSLEASGIELARIAVDEADCRILVLDLAEDRRAEDERLLAAWPDTVVVANKSDLPHRWGDVLPAGAIVVSAVTGDGLEELVDRIVRQLVPDVPASDDAVPTHERHFRVLEEAREAFEHGRTESALSSLRSLCD